MGMRWTGFAVVVLALAGCAAKGPGPGPGLAATAQPADDAALFVRAVERSAVFDPANVRPLKPLTYPVQALMLTNDPSWAIGRQGQTVTLASEYGSWITIEPEVREICGSYAPSDVIRRLHYLLGLKPAGAGDAQARFVRFTVASQPGGPAGGVYRPCADPDPGKTACGNQIAGGSAYASWFAGQQVFSYRRGPDLTQTGYPWTRLGYTYNWDPQAPDIRGAQEYIVPGGTRVTVTEVVAPEAYCAR